MPVGMRCGGGLHRSAALAALPGRWFGVKIVTDFGVYLPLVELIVRISINVDWNVIMNHVPGERTQLG